jgi:hypothetical protein
MDAMQQQAIVSGLACAAFAVARLESDFGTPFCADCQKDLEQSR